MKLIKRYVFIFVLSLSLLILQSVITSGVFAQPYEIKVGTELTMFLDLWDLGYPDTFLCYGSETIIFSDPFPDPGDPAFDIIETEIIELDLVGPRIQVGRNSLLPSPGIVRELDPIEPGIDFPAESFFDVYTELTLDALPGDTFITYDPIHIPSIIDQWPPYFETYERDIAEPPIPVFRKDGTPAGELHYFKEKILPYYEPVVVVSAPTAYMSEVALLHDRGPMEGRVKLTAALSGDRNYEAIEAIFRYRPEGEPGPFIDFWVDPDGMGLKYSTKGPLGPGDGFTAFFEPGSEPFEEHVYEFEACLLVPPLGYLCDTFTVFVDPTPPIPEFVDFDEDSVGYFQVDSFFDIMFKVDDEFTVPGTAELWLFPLLSEYSRDLTEINQLGLDSNIDSSACAPTAAASCLKYFADNGYPGLDNPGGDEAKPEQSGEDMAWELAAAMGTDERGTTPGEMVSGIGSYLESHGQSGWTVEHGEVSSETDLGEMIREFESDGEDILMFVDDTTSAGDTIGHVVTLGSVTTSYFETVNPPPPVGSTSRSLDFMDPWGGGSTADNNYETGKNDQGQTTLTGYDLNGAGGDGWVAGYIKVSPPESASSSSSVDRPADNASAARPGWLIADSGIAHGNGMIDVLHWDTTTFPGGLYLMEIVTTDDQGITCRDLRLAGIPTYTVDDDSSTPSFKTILRGSYPNPFNPTTTIEFSLEKKTKVTLIVYDVSGRKIRTLIPGETIEEGIHKVDWDGKDDNGNRISSGVYFCRFRAEGLVEARKLILLR